MKSCQNNVVTGLRKLQMQWVLLLLLPLLSNCATIAPQITVTGKIAVKGNEPFTFLSISNEKEEYEISGELEAKIRQNLQGRTATLQGILLQDEDSAASLALPKLRVLGILSAEDLALGQG